MHTNTIKHETWGLVEIDSRSFSAAAQHSSSAEKNFAGTKSRPNPKTETGKLSGV
jgi:hypothetical protein